ncbi:hypothetical protein [Aromatoleum bremense]|uniref:Uncharacterized protein n=1 Tax=Aromatoleum bremense TaxID=76115 RepID=A0ABX1NWA4_9RHOO|nr:hypothetical protein [Aromatoleum bremense]NMG16304.1 hypothetical protein [Aromatoleum bremense]QTQ33636.1 Uncharacterized protein pbN1_36510 [Aromatoleum bremense]
MRRTSVLGRKTSPHLWIETGTIEVESRGKLLIPTMRVLRELALRLQLAITNSQGNPYNTRQLGKVVIEKIKDREGEAEQHAAPDVSAFAASPFQQGRE